MPETLYQYTSVETLAGIVASKCLWATRTCYLNDTTEIVHGRELTCSAAKRRLTMNPNEEPTGWIAERYAVPPPPDWSIEWVFDEVGVVSLTALRDDLPMWDRYAVSATGVAIGFSSAWLHQRATVNGLAVCPEFALHSVRYEDQEKLALLDDTLAFFHRTLEARLSDPSWEGDPSDACFGAAQSFSSVLACLKHPAFASEHEWRLATVSLSGWVEGAGKEHVEVASWADPTFTCPIVEVCMGARTDAADAKQVEDCLVAAGLNGIPLIKSAVPLR